MRMSIGGMMTAVLMSVAGKLITALGVGFVSYAGLDYMQGKFTNWLLNHMGSIPADILQIFYIFGGGVVLNWIFGAVTFIATVKGTSHLTASLRK